MDRSEWVPYFRSADDLIQFLESLKALDGEGGDGIHPWKPAQAAIAGIRASAAPPPPAEQSDPYPNTGDALAEFITNTPQDAMHQRLLRLGWTPPAEQAPINPQPAYSKSIGGEQASGGAIGALNRALGDAFPDDPVSAIRAQRAVLPLIAALSQRPVVEGIDWRWQFVHTSAMRYMDGGLAKKAAERAAEQDALLIEATSDKPVRVSGGGDEAAQRDARTERELQRAAAELPDGYVIQVCVEKHAGWVELVHPDGTTQPVDDDEASLATAVATALDAALAPQQQGGAE